MTQLSQPTPARFADGGGRAAAGGPMQTAPDGGLNSWLGGGLLFLVGAGLACAVAISSHTAAQKPKQNENSDLAMVPVADVRSPLSARDLVAAKIGDDGTFEETPMEGGTGVLVDGQYAFWVKEGKVFALNGVAKILAPDLEYGPPGSRSEDLRRRLHPDEPVPVSPRQAKSQPRSEHVNPLGTTVHDVLRKRGYLAHGGDVLQSINVWRHRDTSASLTGQFEGQGNGMFLRRISSLEMEQNGVVLWKTTRIRVDQGELYIDVGSGWQRPDIGEPIAAATPRPTAPPDYSVPESKRRQIYFELCAAQDAGVGDTQAYVIMARKYGIPTDEVYAIAGEGAIKRWPLPPLR